MLEWKGLDMKQSWRWHASLAEKKQLSLDSNKSFETRKGNWIRKKVIKEINWKFFFPR